MPERDGARARFGAPPLDAARRSTWEPRGSFLLAGAALQALDGARARFGASPLDAARRSTSGSGRCPSAFRGPPPLDAARRSAWEPRGSFLLTGAALQALDGTRARFGAPSSCCQAQHLGAWRLTWEPRGSFLLTGAALQAQHLGASRLVSAGDSLTHTRQTHTRSLTVPFAHGARAGASLDRHTVDAHTFAHGARARFTLDTHLGASRLVSAGRGSTSGSGRCPSAFRGPPPSALGSLAARFCWQGQHFRLWTVPERVSGPPI